MNTKKTNEDFLKHGYQPSGGKEHVIGGYQPTGVKEGDSTDKSHSPNNPPKGGSSQQNK